MSFVSPEFALFCLFFLPLYWALASHARWQRGLLIVTGYGLYATWVPVFAWVLLAYSTVMWALGRWMSQAGRTRWPLYLGLWLAGSFLLSLKYYEFVRETFQTVLQNTGFYSLLPVLDVVAPVGVSFFTFQAVTYLVMVGRQPQAARSWPDVLLFLSFWPTLFAGPILRADHFFAQLDQREPTRRVGLPRKAWLALYLITLGLVQKVVLASWLSAQWVDPVYKFPEQASSVVLAAAMVAYSLQIFLDFAGYTAIVTGLALLLGFRLTWPGIWQISGHAGMCLCPVSFGTTFTSRWGGTVGALSAPRPMCWQACSSVACGMVPTGLLWFGVCCTVWAWWCSTWRNALACPPGRVGQRKC